MLGAMAREFFAASPLLVYPVAALILFLAAFAMAVWRALRRPAAELRSIAALPLSDGGDEEVEP